jgi:GH35 family endo-1,4-beta-xylanase
MMRWRHALVWQSQTGAWVFQGTDGKPADRDTLLARLRDHIRTVVGRGEWHEPVGRLAPRRSLCP